MAMGDDVYQTVSCLLGLVGLVVSRRYGQKNLSFSVRCFLWPFFDIGLVQRRFCCLPLGQTIGSQKVRHRLLMCIT